MRRSRFRRGARGASRCFGCLCGWTKRLEVAFLTAQSKANATLYPHPFSRAYWHQAASEVRNTRMLVFGALMIALRVALKQVSIPITADLKINTAFIVNAMGAMVMGPVLSALCAAITDTLGSLLFPSGPYFFPFIFTEMAGSVVFALFLYRASITPGRIILCRFSVNFLVNIVLQTPIMMWYYEVMLGKYYAPIDLLRIVKNLTLFPLESLVLIVLLRYMVPVFRRAGYAVWAGKPLELNKRAAALLMALAILGAAALGGYAWLNYNNTSLSASYSAQERYEKNVTIGEKVLESHPEVNPDTAVCVIESAYPRAFSPVVTYTVAVYSADLSAEEDPQATLEALRALSRSKAAASPLLTKLFTEVGQTGENGEWQVVRGE